MKSLDERLNLLDRTFLSLETRSGGVEGGIRLSNECIDILEVRAAKTLEELLKRIKRLEDRLDNVGSQCDKILEKT